MVCRPESSHINLKRAHMYTRAPRQLAAGDTQPVAFRRSTTSSGGPAMTCAVSCLREGPSRGATHACCALEAQREDLTQQKAQRFAPWCVGMVAQGRAPWYVGMVAHRPKGERPGVGMVAQGRALGRHVRRVRGALRPSCEQWPPPTLPLPSSPQASWPPRTPPC